MTDELLDYIQKKAELKDPKGSVRRKYQNRLRRLAYMLDDFILHAERRLDAAKAGKIHKRAETEALLKDCKALRDAISVKKLADEELPPEDYLNFCDIFGLDPDLPEDGSSSGQAAVSSLRATGD